MDAWMLKVHALNINYLVAALNQLEQRRQQYIFGRSVGGTKSQSTKVG
jgi:hypothetical protein